jgi:lipid-binding SYLF domain-containing protein
MVKTNSMKARPAFLAWLALAVCVCLASPSQAISGSVRVTVTKAGFIVGGGRGRGVLSFRHRNYPFTVQGLSLGFTAGASVNRLVGRADDMNELRDFTGTYSVVGAGVALLGGIGGVQLKNDKGVIITLQGAKAGLEVSANVTKVVITLDPSRSTPD